MDVAYDTEKQKKSKCKYQKSICEKYRKRDVRSEILALDPDHKPRGGYKQLMRVIIDDYAIGKE